MPKCGCFWVRQAIVRDEMRAGQATEPPSTSASSSYLICRSTVIGSCGVGGSTAALSPAAHMAPGRLPPASGKSINGKWPLPGIGMCKCVRLNFLAEQFFIRDEETRLKFIEND
ncbi:hypothetical protein OUZ56_000561 [Daphnia magna]|uniref:Uncharacterized protein n=1 Tax=Daphnia magna TaxID=35525 RepID=A0ABR0A014_9CRUS|nr:hypothetical protein OUZ56_000561 [Daphnia magna]